MGYACFNYGYTTYILDNPIRVAGLLWNYNDIWTSIFGVDTASRAQMIVGAYVTSFAFSNDFLNNNTDEESIYFGNQTPSDLLTTGHAIKTNPYFTWSINNNYTTTFNFYKSSLNFQENFLDYDAYTSYTLNLPLYGAVNLSYWDIKDGFTVSYDIELSTGSTSIIIQNVNYTILTISCNAYFPIMYTGTSNPNALAEKMLTFVSGISSIATAIVGTSSTTFNSGYSIENQQSIMSRGDYKGSRLKETFRENTSEIVGPSTTTHTQSNFSNVSSRLFNSLHSLINTYGGSANSYNNGGGLSSIINTKICLKIERSKQIEDVTSLIGGQFNMKTVFDNITGYCQATALQIKFNCLTDEYNEIVELFKNGVYINA